MFKSARWRGEKNKIKVVFQLQFQATQVPQLKAKTLTMSLVPADVGKPTVRLGKAAVQEGTCSWQNPVYETVKLIREPKTGRYKEKIYYLVVSTGSSKSGILGEASVDFACYAEEAKPLMFCLPLNASDSGPMLHVTMQKMQGADDVRDTEENEAPDYTNLDRSLYNQYGDYNRYGNRNLNFTDEHYNNKDPLEVDQYSYRAPQLENTIIYQEISTLGWNSMPQNRPVNASLKEGSVHRRSNTYRSAGSSSNGNMIDSNSPENYPRDQSREPSNNSIERLKSKIFTLERQAEMSEVELQSLRKQIVKESRRGQDLSKQVVCLKSERDALKTECAQLKSSQQHIDNTEILNTLQQTENLRALLEKITQELKNEKDKSEFLRLQMQKMEYPNSKSIEPVEDLDEMFEHRSSGISKCKVNLNIEEDPTEWFSCKVGHDESKKGVEAQIEEQNTDMEANRLVRKITELNNELEIYKKYNEELKIQMEQLEYEYEILKQDNQDICFKLEQNQKEQMKMQEEYSECLATIRAVKPQLEELEDVNKKQALELSKSLEKINKLQTQIKSSEKELEDQVQYFEDDLQAVTQAKIEQEQRAIRAEEALRKTRWNNANAADRLQEDLKRLSMDMASKFDEKENQAKKAAAEAKDLLLQKRHLEEMLQKANRDIGLIENQYTEKLHELEKQINLQVKQIEQMSLELDDKCKKAVLLERREQENGNTFSIEIQTLKSEIERLNMENTRKSEDIDHNEKISDETEKMKTSTAEVELVQRWSKEKEEMETEIASVRKEAEKLKEESIIFGALNEEKHTVVGTLQSEMKRLRIQYEELKHCLSKIALDKENLKKHVFKLEDDLQNREQVMSTLGKKPKIMIEQATDSDVAQMISKEEKSNPLPYFVKYVSSLTEKLRLTEETTLTGRAHANTEKLEGRTSIEQSLCDSELSTAEVMSIQKLSARESARSEIESGSKKEEIGFIFQNGDDCDLENLLTQMTSLKFRNKHMEDELKEMEEKYSDMSLKFAEVEGERQRLVMTLRNMMTGKKK